MIHLQPTRLLSFETNERDMTSNQLSCLYFRVQNNMNVSRLELLDLCYLQELDVILCVWKLLQLSVSPPQIIDLLLQSLQSSFSSTHCSLFLISDHLCHLRSASLNGANELSKDPLTVLRCCLCRALLGHIQVIQASVGLKEESLNWDWDEHLFFSRLTLWDSIASLSCWRSFSLCWILCWNVFCIFFSCFCRTNRW